MLTDRQETVGLGLGLGLGLDIRTQAPCLALEPAPHERRFARVDDRGSYCSIAANVSTVAENMKNADLDVRREQAFVLRVVDPLRDGSRRA